MNPCLECDICDKLSECCNSHPETGESVSLVMSNKARISACPSLDEEGFCSSYDSRPSICQEYACHKFYNLDLVELSKRGPI